MTMKGTDGGDKVKEHRMEGEEEAVKMQ